jgi:hypothetical protein
MKRILAISLLWASGIAAAQNPAVVQKNVQTAVKASTPAPTATVSVKPSPTTAKVAPVSTAKTTVVAAKPAVSVAKPVAIQAKPVAIQIKAAVAAKAAPAKTVAVPAAKTSATATKSVAVPVKAQAAVPAAKTAAVVAAPVKGSTKAAAAAVKAVSATVKVNGAKVDPFKSAKTNPTATKENNTEDKKPATMAKSVGQAGRRDPFLSPVVNMGAVGSGCSSGKRCLAIDAISLRGIVKSDNGMIAVVVNATDKAYFLHENDPVFNGYVVKITGNSVVFKETFHDRLGKPLTRDITKTISRPVA